MKYLFTVLFTFLFMACTHGQGYQIITSVDTLQSGDVIVTQTDINGNIIDKGLAKPGFVFENDTSELVFTPPSPPENTGDIFVDNIDMPGVDGGFLPQDIVFNPHNGNYYIYGYRKVLVCDADLNVIKTLEISKLDNFLGFYSDYDQKMICVHPTQNKVYCLTLEGVLVEIDQYYNLSELTPSVPDALIERGSMFCLIDGNNANIWFYLQVLDENEDQNTLLYKYSTAAGGTLNSLELEDEISYDLTFISLPTNYKVYLSTHDGIEIFTHELTQQTPISPSFAFDHIQVLNNLLFAHPENMDMVHIYEPNGLPNSIVSGLDYTDFRYMQACEGESSMFISGYYDDLYFESGVKIIEYEAPGYVISPTIVDISNAFGLVENSLNIVACGKNKIAHINKDNHDITFSQNTNTGQMFRISSGNSNVAIAVQPENGNAVKDNGSALQFLDIGGYVISTAIKGDLAFNAISKNNDDGYILAMNSNPGKILHKYEPSFDFNPVAIFTSKASNNHFLYVLYRASNTENDLKALYIDTENNSIYNVGTLYENFDYEHEVIGYLAPETNLVYLIRSKTASCLELVIKIFDENLEYITSNTVEGACFTELKHFPEAGYIVFVSKCGLQIWFFDEHTHDTVGSVLFYEEAPRTITYDPNENLFYCAKDADYYTIDDQFALSAITGTPLLDLTKLGSFFNQVNKKVYIVCESKILIFDEGLYETVVDIDDNWTSGNHRIDDFVFSPERNELYLLKTISSSGENRIEVLVFDCTNNEMKDPIDLELYYTDGTGINVFPDYCLAYNNTKENLFVGNLSFSNTSIISTHTHTHSLTGNWDWISFPCMPRLSNEGYGSQELLENLNPLQPYLELNTKVGGGDLQLTYTAPYWETEDIPDLISTQGYKYYTNPIANQELEIPGVVLDPSTPIPLSSQHENWIGYFLEFPLLPEDAFVGVWDQLISIITKDWTMFKNNGQWFSSSRVTPIQYGDGLIVATSVDSDLIWNYASEPAEEYEYPPTEYFSYNETAEYTPFYFEMDSTEGIKEIALTVNDSCVGAAVVEPGDSIVEVNAYLTGTPSGVPVEVETWSGYKSAKLCSESYSVVDLPTKKRISRKIYTGEHRPYYVLSFKAGETRGDEKLVMLQPPSPNPFTSSTMLSFVLKHQANISLTVHDLRGRPVKTLMGGAYTEGLYETAWTGTDASGGKVENGIYIIRLTVDEKIVKNEKVVLIR